MKTNMYAVSAGRLITYDGQPLITIGRAAAASPTDADALTHEIARLLNSRKKSVSDITMAYMRNSTHGRRNMAGRSTASADADAAKELSLFIENDGDLYRQQWQPILKNLANKRAQGKYDREKAIKLFMYLMESGAKKYAKDFGGTWNVLFNVPTRREAAKEFTLNFEHYDDEGTYDSYLTKVSAKARAAKPNRAGARRARRA
jgi:hypothetical protein